MNCKRAEELILTDYIDGALKGDALKELEDHIALCDECRNFAWEAASAGKAVKALKKETPPAGIWQNIKAEVSQKEEPMDILERVLDPLRQFLAAYRPAVAVAVAAVMVLFVLTALRVTTNTGALTTAVTQDDILMISSLDNGWSDTDESLGTSAEEYFL
jgi:anti-sigma factor RsiW